MAKWSAVEERATLRRYGLLPSAYGLRGLVSVIGRLPEDPCDMVELQELRELRLGLIAIAHSHRKACERRHYYPTAQSVLSDIEQTLRKDSGEEDD